MHYTIASKPLPKAEIVQLRKLAVNPKMAREVSDFTIFTN